MAAPVAPRDAENHMFFGDAGPVAPRDATNHMEVGGVGPAQAAAPRKDRPLTHSGKSYHVRLIKPAHWPARANIDNGIYRVKIVSHTVGKKLTRVVEIRDIINRV